MRLYIFAASFAFGVGLGSFAGPSLSISLAIFGIFIASVLFLYARFAVAPEQRQKLFIAPLVVLAFAFGLGRFALSDMPRPDPLGVFADKKVTIIGLVSEDPDERETYTLLTIDATAESSKGQSIMFPEKIQAQVPVQSRFRYGDTVELSGKLQRPQDFQTDTGTIFHYKNYLAKDGIRYQLEFAQGKATAHGGGNILVAKLIGIKRAFEGAISRSIPDPQGALENGILLGAKQSLGKEVLADFNNAGLSHVVVLSGYNIAIVAKTAEKLLGFLPRAAALGFGALSVVLFTIMAGATASSVRAAIMALVALLGKAVRREYSVVRALIIAAFLMAVQNPLIVPFDPSFQLSFLATFGLVAVSPIVGSRAGFITEKYNIREIVVSTVSTQLFVLPFLFYMSGQFSLAAFPANLLVLPLVPATMLLGTIVGFSALVSHALALLPSFASFALLTYILKVTHFFASISYGVFKAANFPLWGLGLWYAVYGALIWLWHSKHPAEEAKKATEVQKFDTSLAYEIVGEVQSN